MSSWDSSAVHEHDNSKIISTQKAEYHSKTGVACIFFSSFACSFVCLFFQFTPDPDFSSFTSSQKQESNYNVST